MDKIITTIPNYDVVEKLGEGHQSIVYKAFHKRNPHRPLALRVLKAALLSEDQKRHFRQKIEHLKILHDTRLITPLSFKVRGDVQFFTQDYFNGITLDEWAKSQTKITLNDFFTIACELAEAIDKVHEAGIIHGGIKPHNILIEPEAFNIWLEAPPVHELNPEVPPILGKIIARLMLKQPEKRYQSASGLLADFIQCRDEYSATGTISEFTLGIYDRTHRVAFISKMVGRDREAEIILEEYDKAARGSFRCLFISGLPGIGKTRLIQELQKPIVGHRGYFTSGKFDVYQKNIPYSSLIQAFRNLIRTFLTESDESVTLWRQKIIKALGSNGRVITDVIPELEILLGPQPEVKPLPPVESRNRFHDLFGRFLTCLASEEYPLALFIDDLQWCDIASLDFLGNIFANHKEHPYLFLVGAYRHNEVDSSHPLAKLIQRVKEKGQPLQEIRLAPLKSEHCHEMVSYILDSPLSYTMSLAGLITELTEGNPLFVSEMLSYLHNEDLLILGENNQWQWEMDKIRESDMPSTVVALFSSKVQKLPSDTIDLLEYCACMGNLFTPDEVVLVREITLLDVFEKLKPALGQGLLIDNKGQLQFVHDRVQEAVLSAIKSETRRQIHWQIGSLLFSAVPEGADLEEMRNLFTKERKSKIELGFYSELIPDLYMSGLVPQLYLSAVQSTQHCLFSYQKA